MVDDVTSHNRRAWDRQVELGNRWTVPVSSEVIAAARRGEWSVVLTPHKPVPREWFPPLEDLRVLCLASAGGQQAPILAAAGARVWVLDASPRQLNQDRLVADRDGLDLATVQGDMADLSAFDDGFFDLVYHPVSNCFAPDVRPVWREAARVLRSEGRLLSGFANPVLYLFDDELDAEGELTVKHRIPYSDVESLSVEEKLRYKSEGSPLEFGHTLDDQIGGQLDAGLVIAGFYEDTHHLEDIPITKYIATFVATLAIKMDEPIGR
jgi:SAM-dependent methyltransferase